MRDKPQGGEVLVKNTTVPTPSHLGGSSLDRPDAFTFMPDVWDGLVTKYNVKRVLDVGCGVGWALEHFLTKVEFVLGVEGDPAALARLRVSPRLVMQHDYTKSPFAPAETFDLGWCAEFVEHVEAKYEENWFATLARCRYVCMTFATPGQGGHHHVNERPEEYWLERFRKHGFVVDRAETAALRATSKGEAWGRRTLTFFKAVNQPIVNVPSSDMEWLSGPMTIEKDVLSSRPRRRNLVVVNRGPGSPPMTRPDNATWDWIEVCWHRDSQRLPADKIVFDGDRNLRRFRTAYKLRDDLGHYENIALLDDDILTIPGASWNEIFALFEETGAGVGHPALTPDSCTGWPFLYQQPGTKWRETNFVELQAPLFTQAALQRYLSAFSDAQYGWGLEDLWCADEPFLAVLDATPVRHVRPVGSADSKTGITYDVNVETAKFRSKYGVQQKTPKTLVSHPIVVGVQHVSSGRPNLVCISRGPYGSVPLTREANANWDWVEFHWLPDQTRDFRNGPDRVIEEVNPLLKHHAVVAKHASTIHLDRYERVAIIADDVRVEGTWGAAFDLLAFWENTIEVQIAQCAHSAVSCSPHTHSRQTSRPTVAREITLVDDAAAFFTRAALRRCLPFFLNNKSLGWSMDRLWSNLGLKMMVFDTIAMTHVSSVGSKPSYDPSRCGGKSGSEWAEEFSRQYPNLVTIREATYAWQEGSGTENVRLDGQVLHRVALQPVTSTATGYGRSVSLISAQHPAPARRRR